MNMQYASVDKPLRTLLVTSATPEEGKTTISINLSIILAQGENEVVLIDSDLRRPRIHKNLNISNRKGLSWLFVQPQINLDGTLQKYEVPGMSILPSGELPPNPFELLSSEKMSHIVGQISSNADMVVIDSPPILVATDAAVLSRYVDGVLFVVKPGVSKWASVKHALEQLQHVDANILGIVFNEIELKRSQQYYYRGYYKYYSYSEDGARRKSRSNKDEEPAAPATGLKKLLPRRK